MGAFILVLGIIIVVSFLAVVIYHIDKASEFDDSYMNTVYKQHKDDTSL